MEGSEEQNEERAGNGDRRERARVSSNPKILT